MNWLDSVSMTLMNKDLDGLWARQQAISNNIANFETPGYKSKNVSFEDQLRRQVEGPERTSRETINDLDGVSPVVSEASDETFRMDGNGVDLEKENLNLARTALNYSYAVQEMSDNFSRLRTAINGQK